MREVLLGVKIDYVRIDQALETVEKWLKKRGKHYIVTPNPEMLVDARSDKSFKLALNQADLAIPDSPRLGWASKVLKPKQPIFRLIYLPFVILPKVFSGNDYPTTTGVDLMESLLRVSEEKAFTTAYLGGSKKVADKLLKCLRLKYPKLKIKFCSGNIKIDKNGQTIFGIFKNNKTSSKDIKIYKEADQPLNPHLLTQNVDILFVAFGHIKQEKWIYRNLPKLNARVMVGVGGAFDYISGSVPRAPLWMRSLGLEWVFRVIIQPWRIKRFWKLPYFVYLVMSSK